MLLLILIDIADGTRTINTRVQIFQKETYNWRRISAETPTAQRLMDPGATQTTPLQIDYATFLTAVRMDSIINVGHVASRN